MLTAVRHVDGEAAEQVAAYKIKRRNISLHEIMGLSCNGSGQKPHSSLDIETETQQTYTVLLQHDLVRRRIKSPHVGLPPETSEVMYLQLL